MTIRTARTKTCPFMQHAALVSVALPSIRQNDLDAMGKNKQASANIDCQGDNCMAWINKFPLKHDSDEGYCALIDKHM